MSDPQPITAADYHRLTKRPKYGNTVTTIDGIRFASKREADRYQELLLLVAAGEITDLTCQPRWEFVVNGLRVGRYTADFAYTDRRSGQLVVEDVKVDATRTTSYQLRKRLMVACHGLVVVEV